MGPTLPKGSPLGEALVENPNKSLRINALLQGSRDPCGTFHFVMHYQASLKGQGPYKALKEPWPFKNLIRPFKGLIRPFKGLKRPFNDVIRPLKGLIP